MRSATRRGGLLAGVTLSALMIALPVHAAGLSLGGIGVGRGWWDWRRHGTWRRAQRG